LAMLRRWMQDRGMLGEHELEWEGSEGLPLGPGFAFVQFRNPALPVGWSGLVLSGLIVASRQSTAKNRGEKSSSRNYKSDMLGDGFRGMVKRCWLTLLAPMVKRCWLTLLMAEEGCLRR
jgi:hypothetical protein